MCWAPKTIAINVRPYSRKTTLVSKMLSRQTQGEPACDHAIQCQHGWTLCASYWTRNSGRISSTLAVSASQSEIIRIAPGSCSRGKNMPLKTSSASKTAKLVSEKVVLSGQRFKNWRNACETMPTSPGSAGTSNSIGLWLMPSGSLTKKNGVGRRQLISFRFQ